MSYPQKYSFIAAILFAMSHSINAVAQDTPLKFESVKTEFINSCASCHGVDAQGAGFLTRLFKGVNPGDLTQLSANNDGKFPLEKVIQIIDGRTEVAAHGDRKMPVWGDRYWETSMSKYGPDDLNVQRARSRILELTYYLQSIQK